MATSNAGIWVETRLGPSVVPFCPFLGEGSPTKLDYTLILASSLEDLGYQLLVTLRSTIVGLSRVANHDVNLEVLWMDEILHHLRNPRTTMSLQIPKDMVSAMVPSTVAIHTEGVPTTF